MEKNKNKKKFRLFDWSKDGKGVNPGEDRTPNLKFFFKQYKRKFTRIISLNLMMLFQFLPIVIAVVLYFAGPTTPTQSYNSYAALYGMQTAAPTASSGAMLVTRMAQQALPTYNTYVYWIIIPLLLFVLITWGWQNTGSTYILRAFVRGDGVFLIGDYFHAIKKNRKQGLLLGVIDLTAILLLVFDIVFFMSSANTTANNLMYGLIIAVAIIFLILRMYIYLLMITFNIKTWKLLKNALIFTVLGLKRNIMAIIGNAILIAFTVLTIVGASMLGASFMGLPIILPFLYLPATSAFINVYAAYPIIDRYMIQPALKKAPSLQSENSIVRQEDEASNDSDDPVDTSGKPNN